MGLDLQGQVGIATTLKPGPKELSRFDVLMCEQSEGWKNNFLFNSVICLSDREFRKITLYAQNLISLQAPFKKKGEESQSIYKTRWRKN